MTYLRTLGKGLIVMKGKKLFKQIGKKLANTVDDVFTIEVVLVEEDNVLIYTHSSPDGDTITYLDDHLDAGKSDVVDFQHRMLLVSRLCKGAYMQLLDEIT